MVLMTANQWKSIVPEVDMPAISLKYSFLSTNFSCLTILIGSIVTGLPLQRAGLLHAKDKDVNFCIDV